MHDILVVLVHSIVTVVRLIRPGGLRAVIAGIGARSASNAHPESPRWMRMGCQQHPGSKRVVSGNPFDLDLTRIEIAGF
jgi:hypothetical protein